MDASVQRTHSQRSQSNDIGPRVSFNKDVHVKRIGPRVNEFDPTLSYSSQLTRELPQDLSEQELLKEATLVLAQAERVKCTADDGLNAIDNRILSATSSTDNKFNSLPIRKKKSKTLNRSVSDASHKKQKKPSIFNLFSKRSDPNLNISTNLDENKSKIAGSSSKRGGKVATVRRSKSDVGGGGGPGAIPNTRALIIDRKRINSLENDDSFTTKKKSQLSPIIEVSQKENYFGDSGSEPNQSRLVRSEERTFDRMNDDTVGFDTNQSLGKNFEGSRSLDSLHSSQLPQQKLPLTKGLTVDGMVKRLSMERFSPPPRNMSPGFSYIRPNNPIVYADVLQAEKGLTSNGNPKYFNQSNEQTDGHHNSHHGQRYHVNDDFRFSPNRNFNEVDEGLGMEPQRSYRYNDHEVITPRRESRHRSMEPPIVPVASQMDYPENLHELSERRRLLESKFRSRSFNQPSRESPNIASRSPDKHHNLSNGRAKGEPVTPRKQWSSVNRFEPDSNHFASELDDLNTDWAPKDRDPVTRYPSYDHNDASPETYPDQIHTSTPKRGMHKFWNGTNQGRTVREDHHIQRQGNKFSSTNNFDKCDSGIENDFKRNRQPNIFNSSETDKNVTALFLKRERQHTELMHPSKKRYNYIFRERSIDDGSHFDPHLDKYPRENNTLRKIHPLKLEANNKKNDKKFGSLKKVKELFSTKSKKPNTKEQSLVSAEELRQRYKVHQEPSPERPENRIITDITTRRRLSTPKASPLPKRSSSQRSSEQKSGWFTSLDRRLNKSKNTKTPPRPQSKENLAHTTNESSLNAPPLRFFGDTDIESIDIKNAKSTTLRRDQKPSKLTNKWAPQNVHEVDSPRTSTLIRSEKHKTRSMQQLPYKEPEISIRSKYNFHDASGSTSENDQPLNGVRVKTSHKLSEPKYRQRRQYHSTEQLQNRHNSTSIDESQQTNNGRSHDKTHRYPLRENYERTRSDAWKPPPAPVKPARGIDRRRAFSSDRDRLHDSSGTEGDSSQSVVYLHATTVGHIPQPNALGSRRSYSRSRDELSSSKYQNDNQPMVRTVSRSMSMLAPWAPKHRRNGYEINYSQTMQNAKKKPGSSSKSEINGTHAYKNRTRSRDDISSSVSPSVATSTKSRTGSLYPSGTSYTSSTNRIRKIK